MIYNHCTVKRRLKLTHALTAHCYCAGDQVNFVLHGMCKVFAAQRNDARLLLQ